MERKSYCGRCRGFTPSIINMQEGIALCKKCGRKHQIINFANILVRN